MHSAVPALGPAVPNVAEPRRLAPGLLEHPGIGGSAGSMGIVAALLAMDLAATSPSSRRLRFLGNAIISHIGRARFGKVRPGTIDTGRLTWAFDPLIKPEWMLCRHQQTLAPAFAAVS